RDLAPREALEIVRDVARALEHAHHAGIVHRDVKPANILLDPGGRPYVTDFGLARDVEDEGARLTRSGRPVGTPCALPPAQARGHRDALPPATDFSGLGVALHEALTFDLPFRGKSSLELADKIQREPPPRPRSIAPSIDPDVEAIILKA